MTGKEETGIFTLYSDVEATAVRWLWYPFIAVGKITLLQGDPGDGKSTMMMNLIAELSKGGTMPDGKQVGIPQKVIYQCSEDDASDTIKPRLETCGTDCRNVAFINEEMNSGLTLDDERIRKAIIQFRPKLVVIDPIQAYLGSDSDLQIAGRARKLM
jgi:predicted ATP-dependent serine protease